VEKNSNSTKNLSELNYKNSDNDVQEKLRAKADKLGLTRHTAIRVQLKQLDEERNKKKAEANGKKEEIAKAKAEHRAGYEQILIQMRER
jgi:hypothetical protein